MSSAIDMYNLIFALAIEAGPNENSTQIIEMMRPFLMFYQSNWMHLYCFVLVAVAVAVGTVPVYLTFELH